MKPYIPYSEVKNPNANSYQAKRKRKSKNLTPEDRQGHLNRMKKSYKSEYHEKELMVPPVSIPCPESFITGPDTLNVGEPGIFQSRTNLSLNSFDIQSAWNVLTPANMKVDQRIIDSIPPYEGQESLPVRFAKDSGERKWSSETRDPVRRWSDGGSEKKWDANEGKKRWEGQQEAAEDTGTQEGFCRGEFTFNKPGLVRMESVPIIPGANSLIAGQPKSVLIEDVAPTWVYWVDDFNDNSLDTAKWYTPAEDCFAFSEVNERLRVEPDSMHCESLHFEDAIQSKCPNSYFTGDYWQVAVDFGDFTGDSKGVYLLYRYGSGATAYKSIEIIYDEGAGTAKYRWGYEGSWSYSTADSRPTSGTLKIRKNGTYLEFWNDIDSQWESTSFVATTQAFPIYMGVLTDLNSVESNNYHSDIGYIEGYHANYATARTDSYFCSTAWWWKVGQQHWDDPKFLCHRLFLSFDTADIPDDAQVSLAYLRMELDSINCSPDFPTWDVRVIKADWQSPVCDHREANYDLGLSAQDDGYWIQDVCNKALGYHNSQNLSNSYINKTGDTRYALVSSRDRSGSAPYASGWRYEYCEIDKPPNPRLTVEYYHKDGQASFDNFAIEAY